MRYTHMSLNTNSDRRVDDKKSELHAAFADLSFAARFELNAALLNMSIDENTDMTCGLQEVSDDACPLFENFLKSKGHTVITNKYCKDPGSFNFIFSYNPAYFELVSQDQFYYIEKLTEKLFDQDDDGRSLTREERAKLPKDQKVKRHMGTEFEKSAQIILLRNKATGELIRVCNTHPGLEMQHRLMAMNALCQFLADKNVAMLSMLSEEEKQRIREIIAGDLNMFDPRIPTPAMLQEQVKILQDAGYHWVTEGLSKVGPQSTFVSFPFDIFRFLDDADKQELDAIKKDPARWPEFREFFIRKIREKSIPLFSTCLDGVFAKNIPAGTTAVFSSQTLFGKKRVEMAKVQDPQAMQAEFLHHFDPKKEGEERSDARFNSDHFALFVKFAPSQDHAKTEKMHEADDALQYRF